MLYELITMNTELVYHRTPLLVFFAVNGSRAPVSAGDVRQFSFRFRPFADGEQIKKPKIDNFNNKKYTCQSIQLCFKCIPIVFGASNFIFVF